eukprot:GGOE01020392.1.p1 GENE.GGOE01020392.1~~GGOE01020392.1.p1  ORF type:complete len:330 (-),score=49.72 GGOE01020392.1:109-1098(-)
MVATYGALLPPPPPVPPIAMDAECDAQRCRVPWKPCASRGRSCWAGLLLLLLLLLLMALSFCCVGTKKPCRWSLGLQPAPDAGPGVLKDTNSNGRFVPRVRVRLAHRSAAVVGKAVVASAKVAHTVVLKTGVFAKCATGLVADCSREFIVTVVVTAVDVARDLADLVHETTGIVLRAVLESWTELLKGYAKVAQHLTNGAARATEDVGYSICRALHTAISSTFASGRSLSRAVVPAASVFVRTSKQVALDVAAGAIQAAQGILAAVDKQLKAIQDDQDDAGPRSPIPSVSPSADLPPRYLAPFADLSPSADLSPLADVSPLMDLSPDSE